MIQALWEGLGAAKDAPRVGALRMEARPAEGTPQRRAIRR